MGLEWEVCSWENVETCKGSLNYSGRLEKQPCGCAGEVVVAMMEYTYTTCCCLWALYLPPCMLASPQHFERGLRLWAATWKEEACFNRYSNLTASWKQNLAASVQPFVLFMLSNILKVLLSGCPWSLSSSTVQCAPEKLVVRRLLRHLILFSVASWSSSGFSTGKLLMSTFLIQGGSFQILGLFWWGRGSCYVSMRKTGFLGEKGRKQ